jgi:3-oxoacyl-[acyl-carrier-protein] synthase-3
MENTSTKILSLGRCLPKKAMSNSDIAKFVDTSDEWIKERTGITNRFVAEEDESIVDYICSAGKEALEKANVKPEDVDLMIVATLTPEQLLPSTAAIAQTKLGVTNAACFDVAAACSGFLYGLNIAHQFIRNGTAKHALIFGAEFLSRFINWNDRTTCIIFGDGVGAALLGPCPKDEGIQHIDWQTDGRFPDLIEMPGGGSRIPPHSKDSIEQGLPYIRMKGNETFKVAVRDMVDLSKKTLEKMQMTVEDLDLFVPHQANLRIIEAVGTRLKLKPEQVYANVDRVGNTSAASVPLALYDAEQEGRLSRGDTVMSTVFGAGLTWASTVFKY